MDLRRHCEWMAEYHGWAYGTLFAALDPLDEERYRLDTGLFFRSIHGTLNHLLLVDHLWYGRLVGELWKPVALSDEVVAERGVLRTELLGRSAVWRRYLDSLTDADLGGVADFRKLDGTPARLPRASCVLHVFNHGTHHRGQVSAAITQLGGKAPEMDLPYFLYTLPAAAY
ncbi:MAG TPA: DinB family protein [Candidatus Saccharimonadia bacterium]|nr:DinB family protein [Candidatus Saccharimonadia bacterium]